jgi:hypothetical protein
MKMPIKVVRWTLLSLLLASVSAVMAQQRPKSGIIGIAHFALRVSSLEHERALLHQLGWEEPFALAVNDKSTEAFFKINDHQFIEIYSRSDSAQKIGWMHLCLESDGLIALQKRYAERGLQPSEVAKGGAGNLLFSLRDPENRVVEFTQYMPGSRHFLDYGHHLEPNRISRQLIGVRIPAKDDAAALKFYRDGLGLHAGEGLHKDTFYTDQKEWIAVSPASVQFVFSVANLPAAKQLLSKRGVAYRVETDAVVVTDSDGNSFAFTTSR